jgi:hypothetical protein
MEYPKVDEHLEILVNFLRKLATDLEENKLEAKDKQLIGEWYMRYLFTHALGEDFNEKELDENGEKVPSQAEMLRFLSLGWYIYNQILKK